ncbi:MAG: hypothetical protein ABSB50_00250 [Terracidiphilus sp.]|jgi:hypothetical protein
MTITYRGHRLFEPRINKLADESGFTVECEIATEVGPATEVKYFFTPEKFSTRDQARSAAVVHFKRYVDSL